MEEKMMSEKNRKEILRWLNPLGWQVKVEREPQLWDTLLRARGLQNAAERNAFFNPDQIKFHDPFLFQDMQAACDLFNNLVQAGKKDFLIFGDYDTDGLCSTAILYRYLSAIGIKPRLLIPERLTEGYDLDLDQVAIILQDPPDFVITVDCGTNAEESVRALKAAGVSVIITDHHQALELPDRKLCPYINPLVADESYPFSYLSGAGVALKFALALTKYYPVSQDIIDTLYTLAAVATVADIMPLLDENRHLVWRGIEIFPQAAPIGLRLLAQERKISSQLFSYQLAPRLNAASRMGKVDVALEFLLSDDYEQSSELAKQLENLNKQRKNIENDIYAEACRQIEAEYPQEKPPIIVAHGIDWHLGVIGIVASKLAERYSCPVIVLSETDGILKGSARSYADFNLLASLDFAAADLLQYGGHEQACGLQLKTEKLEDFKQSLKKYSTQNAQNLLTQPLLADCQMDVNEVTFELIKQLEKFEPVGQANPAPLFVFPNLQVEQIFSVGQGKHLRLTVSDGCSADSRIDMIGFNLGNELSYYRAGDRVDVLGITEINEYKNSRKIQVNMQSIRTADETRKNSEAIADWIKLINLWREGKSLSKFNKTVSVSTNIFPVLWQLLSSVGGENQEPFVFKPSRVARLLREGYNVISSELSLLLALSVLEEAGLISLMLEEKADALLISAETAEETKPRLRETDAWLLLEQCGGIKE